MVGMRGCELHFTGDAMSMNQAIKSERQFMLQAHRIIEAARVRAYTDYHPPIRWVEPPLTWFNKLVRWSKGIK